MPDRFPEACLRFERVVDVDRITSFRQLKLTFASWAGQNWLDTYRQNEALKVEARKHGIPLRVEGRPPVASRGFAHVSERVTVTWRHETVTVKSILKTDTETLRRVVSSRSPRKSDQRSKS